MGRLVEGVWQDEPVAGKRSDGRFVRADTQFRNWVTADGSAGPIGTGGFAAAPGRYHLYVSLACPWAHRTLILRRLKGLEEAIGVSVVHWHMAEHGWTFAAGPGSLPMPAGSRAWAWTRWKPGARSPAHRSSSPGASFPRNARRSSARPTSSAPSLSANR